MDSKYRVYMIILNVNSCFNIKSTYCCWYPIGTFWWFLKYPSNSIVTQNAWSRELQSQLKIRALSLKKGSNGPHEGLIPSNMAWEHKLLLLLSAIRWIEFRRNKVFVSAHPLPHSFTLKMSLFLLGPIYKWYNKIHRICPTFSNQSCDLWSVRFDTLLSKSLKLSNWAETEKTLKECECGNSKKTCWKRTNKNSATSYLPSSYDFVIAISAWR